ncbi:TatD family hydrolase [Shewanella avicenniae]|uniref:TatD family hydrolase n=1 Tax=Shewanella avicenniae TaxID=2814294 RepID=A0ABX7QST1_9GAMM|nr:TatD family hydrolase [Shewanella avicenniae]QSX34529.1 TatD family hydrolase [Shewanella avicenniae]
MQLTDSHAHLDLAEFAADRAELWQQMQQQGISRLILPGIAPEQWPSMQAIAAQYQWQYALGIHPWYLPDDQTAAIAQLNQQLQQAQGDPLLIAVGECGLDKLRAKRMQHSDEHNWHRQLSLFTAQLALAQQFSLPLIVHAVQCHGDMLQILQQERLRRGGVIHGFSGSIEVALQYWQLGFRVGIGGLVLNPEAKKLRDAVAQLPVAAILLETDSPDMAPKCLDGARNTPLTLTAVVAEVAKLTNLSVVQLAEQLELNRVQLFEC